MPGLKILHANANTLVRAGLRSILFQGGGVDKLFNAENTQELIDKLDQEKPELLIIDYDQPSHFSDQDILAVKRQYPNTKILIISTENNPTRILTILETGVHGYLTRECDEGEIINAVFAIAKGEKFYCNKIINIILEKNLKPDEEEDCDPTSLSEREIEITTLIAQGMTNKEIASTLHLSVHTVNTHRKNIMKKLGVNSTSGLVLYAVNAGFVRPTGNNIQ